MWRVVWGVLMLLLLLAGCMGNSSLGMQCESVADFSEGTHAKCASLPKNQQSSHSHTANTRIVDSKARNPHAKPKSPVDSKRASAVGYSPTAIKSHSGDKRSVSPTLKASSGWGIVKGEGATSQFKPLPLNKKEKEILKNNRILEVKSEDSEKLDSESENRAESAIVGDSEKRGLESERLESTTDSESKNQTKDSNNQDFAPTNDINTPLANTTESDEEVQEDGQTYRAHISYKKGSKIKHGRDILYYLNGTIAKQSFYLNGRLEGKVEIFSQKGVLIYEAHYRAGQLNGLCKIYDVASGRLKSEMNFENGLQEGQMSVYDSSGKLWHRLEYKQGKRDGIAIEYDDSGKILRQTRYIDDKEAG